MKRTIALLLTLVMTFALCGCGNSSTNEKSSANSGTSQSTQDNGKDLISVEEFSLNPDRGWRDIKVRNLSGKTVPCFIVDYVFIDANGDVIDTTGHITTDRIMIDDGQAFTEQDQHIMADNDYSKVEKVKFTTYTLRDVLNGEFRWVEEYAFIDPPVFVRNSDGTFSKYSGTDGVALSDAPSAVESSDEDITDATVYALNDTVETDSVKLTVSEFFYEDQIIGSITQLAKLNPDDGEIWACIGLTLENIGKDQFAPYDILRATIDYNDGYTYSTKDATSLILNSEMKAYYYRAGGIGMKLSPLTSEKYCLAISCSPKLREDTESPINIMFELPDGSGTRTFIFKVQ